MTGIDLANRLLKNIETSLELRSRVPYLDMLMELRQGGISLSNEILNTSSNFGSFDTALKEVLAILHIRNSNFMPPPDISPLRLTVIHQNLSSNITLLSEVLQDYIDLKVSAVKTNESTATLLLYKLETINLAAV
ncbi:hypothetical protein [Pedobacter cryoconitis]|uniref:Uncharacterized protein n=1 Tax=Pedobacter cryoconitis TaxID=188932 RepID=A0A7X0J3A9_9SPHI|nr:hypothetical protein [Pedobacter cryoconitis]MBB6498851.1 hypothetical protein [Pedobacter cryoconitis]